MSDKKSLFYMYILYNKHRRREKYEMFLKEQDSTIELRIALVLQETLGDPLVWWYFVA